MDHLPLEKKYFLDFPNIFSKSPTLRWDVCRTWDLLRRSTSVSDTSLKSQARPSSPPSSAGDNASYFKVETKTVSCDLPQLTFSLSVITFSLWLRERDKETHFRLAPASSRNCIFPSNVVILSALLDFSFYHINKPQALSPTLRERHLSFTSNLVSLFSQPSF